VIGESQGLKGLKGLKVTRAIPECQAPLFEWAQTIVRRTKSWSALIVPHQREILFRCSQLEIEGRDALRPAVFQTRAAYPRSSFV
jgi:hypothetical protein